MGWEATVIGGVGGFASSYYQSREQAQALTNLKSDIQRVLRNAQTKYEEERERFLGLETSQLGTQFLLDAFRDPLGGGFAQEYQDRVRQAQEARGFVGGGGGAGATQEGTFLARIADQRRQQLLPVLNLFELQAQQAGSAAFNRKATYASLLAGLGPSPASVGPAIAQGVAGAFGGYTIAQEQARRNAVQGQAALAGVNQAGAQNLIRDDMYRTGTDESIFGTSYKPSPSYVI